MRFRYHRWQPVFDRSYVEDLPDYDGDIELEAKAKDLALLQIR